jgi:diaminopimelate decarboxylase
MNDFLRPTLYQAYHEILMLRHTESDQTVDVVGPICESGDFFARDREMGPVGRGDLLAIMNAGAYGFTLSSNYNSRLRAAEVLVEGAEFRIIRSRETWPDLVRSELNWLK